MVCKSLLSSRVCRWWGVISLRADGSGLLTNKDRCETRRKSKGMMKDYKMSLAISFALYVVEKIGLWSCLSSIIITEVFNQMERETDECGKRCNK